MRHLTDKEAIVVVVFFLAVGGAGIGCYVVAVRTPGYSFGSLWWAGWIMMFIGFGLLWALPACLADERGKEGGKDGDGTDAPEEIVVGDVDVHGGDLAPKDDAAEEAGDGGEVVDTVNLVGKSGEKDE